MADVVMWHFFNGQIPTQYAISDPAMWSLSELGTTALENSIIIVYCGTQLKNYTLVKCNKKVNWGTFG